MQESLHNYMKVGMVHFMVYPQTMRGEGPVLETVERLVCDEYFDAIEVTWIQDSGTRQKVAKLAEQSGVQLAYGGQPRLLTTGMNINDLDDEKRMLAVASLREGIDEAYELGAVGFALLSGRYEEDTKEKSFDALVQSLDNLCSYAKSKGNMPIILEVFDYDIDKKSLIGPVQMAKRLAQQVRETHDNFGLMVDLSHIPMIHESIRENLLPIKEYILHAHMGNTVIKSPDCAAYGDQHPRFGFPNSENDIEELSEYLRTLLEIGYLSKETRPILSFEVKPWQDENSEALIANCKRKLNLAWSLI